MALIEINWHPADKDLRDFGRVAVIATFLLALLLHVIKGLALKWCAVIIGFGLFVFLCSMISIKVTRWIYLGLTLLTFPIGMVVSFILMAAFYYLLLTPVGLFFRLIKRDPLRRKFDPSIGSYWIRRRQADNIKRYFNQF